MRTLGRVVAGASGDQSGIIGICRRCAIELDRFPNQRDRMNRAVERAFDNPPPYFCTLFDDPNTAILAVGLIGHPAYATQALQAVGWSTTQ